MQTVKTPRAAAEDFARTAIRDTFKQDLDEETLKAVTEKIMKALPQRQHQAA